MSTSTTMGAGLAFEPEKDLATFAEMAARGKHLTGVARLGHGWRFVEGTPEDAVFDLAYEHAPAADYLDYFRAAGWAHVLTVGDVHIFKAAPGTPPVHTGSETRREEMLRERNRFLGFSLLAVLLFLGVGLGIRHLDGNVWLELVLLFVAFLPVVYTVLPLAGYWYRSATLPRGQ